MISLLQNLKHIFALENELCGFYSSIRGFLLKYGPLLVHSKGSVLSFSPSFIPQCHNRCSKLLHNSSNSQGPRKRDTISKQQLSDVGACLCPQTSLPYLFDGTNVSDKVLLICCKLWSMFWKLKTRL